MLSWFTRWFSLSSYSFSSPSKPQIGAPLVLRVAGLAFEKRADRLIHYRLGEYLRIRHDAQNEYDPHALAIEDRKGFVMGYVDKNISHRLLPLLPALKSGILAEITQLKRDADGQSAGLKVCIRCPEEVLEKLYRRYEIDFLIKKNDDESCLLLIECTDTTYFGILRRLKLRGFKHEGVGISYKLASNGRLYDRYIKLAPIHSEEDIMDFFLNEFHVRPMEQETLELLDEMSAENQAEQEVYTSSVEELEKKVVRLEKELKKIRPLAESNQRLRSIEARLGEEYPEILKTLLPHLVFKRDSMKRLIEGLQEPKDALEKLAILNAEQHVKEAKKVKGAKGWWEVYFRTGTGENGRLYYQPLDTEIEVLVSIKQQQNQDMGYLRGQ